MNFQFENLLDFMTMNGHGPFVWASYLVTLAVVLILIAVPYWQRKQLVIQLRRQQRIEANKTQPTASQEVE